MRVPKDVADEKAVQIGVEFKSEAFGVYTASRSVVGLKPSLNKALRALWELQRKNDNEGAVKGFEALFAEFPDNMQLLNDYAWYLINVEDPKFRNPEKAMTLAGKILKLSEVEGQEISPGRLGGVYFMKSRIYHMQKDLEMAVKSCEKAYELATNQYYRNALKGLRKEYEASKTKTAEGEKPEKAEPETDK